MLVSTAADEYGHLDLHFNALRHAFAERGIELTRCEAGRPDSQQLAALARDPDLLFFLCFNGWGANLAWQGADGARQSFFSHIGKPLLDHFADPPFADEMQHALQFDMPERLVLYTDHSYLAWDSLYGQPRHSSYFLPQFVPDVPDAPAHAQAAAFKPHRERSIGVLLPVSLYDPDHYYRQMLDAMSDRREAQALFDELVGTYLHDLRADPLAWVATLWLKKGRPFDASDPVQQRVMSAAWHYIKNRRRQLVLEALADVPLTIVTKTIPYTAPLHSRTTVLAPRPFADLAALAGDARLCICPTPHVRGFHERVLLALSRGAVALSSPNQVCEEQFRDGEDMLYYQDHGADLRQKIQACSDDADASDAMGRRGAAALKTRFSAEVTVDSMLRIFHNYRARTLPAAHPG